jgi:hypothetical protein
MGTYVSLAAALGRNWSTQPVAATLVGAGFVQTSDTGQVNLTTFTLPGPLDGLIGYQVYRFSDSLQGTDPIFIKATYHRGTNYMLKWYLQVGQGSDGAGNLTGTVSASYHMGDTAYSTMSADAVSTDYGYSETGVVWIATHAVPSGQNLPPRHFFCITRTKDVAGNFDGRGVIVHFSGSDPRTNGVIATLIWGVGSTSVEAFSYDYCLILEPNAGLTDSGQKIAWPHYYYDNGTVRQCWAQWTTHGSFLTTGVNYFTAAPYGLSRSWFAIGDAAGRGIAGIGTSSNTWVLVLPWA